MQAYVERGYALFLSRVANGRKKPTAMVDSIAQGRVWTGNQALKIGLVDKMGTLEDAVAEAKRRAKLSDVVTVDYPAQASWMDQFINTTKDRYIENHLRAQLGEYYRPLRFAYSIQGRDKLQARIPFEPNLK
ncbi:MAG: S49 family peptidase, partial [Bacteroidaceae bacterium]|nr:S49 family peptidase [Bacteroidaceae bacterium]